MKCRRCRESSSPRLFIHPCCLIHVFARFSPPCKKGNRLWSTLRAQQNNNDRRYYCLRCIVCTNGPNYCLPVSRPLYNITLHKEGESISPPLKSSLALWFSLTHRIWYDLMGILNLCLEGPCCFHLLSWSPADALRKSPGWPGRGWQTSERCHFGPVSGPWGLCAGPGGMSQA